MTEFILRKIIGYFLISIPFLLWLWLFKSLCFDTWRQCFAALTFIFCLALIMMGFFSLTIGLGIKLLSKK